LACLRGVGLDATSADGIHAERLRKLAFPSYACRKCR
jgi:hypothetical protein